MLPIPIMKVCSSVKSLIESSCFSEEAGNGGHGQKVGQTSGQQGAEGVRGEEEEVLGRLSPRYQTKPPEALRRSQVFHVQS